MNWEEVKKTYPSEWVLVEAIKAYSKDGQRYVEDMAVINRFSDSLDVMKKYKELHRLHPFREYYFFHTDRKELDIHERNWFGIRGVK